MQSYLPKVKHKIFSFSCCTMYGMIEIKLSDFLQDTAGTSSGYAEGGGLYALGLIHANHGAEIIEYLLGQVGFLSAPYHTVHHI